MAYTWDNAMDEGRRRLALLERFLDPGTFRRLETIGVGEGWRCLDVGAGGGTVCEWLTRRVGATGRVCAVDVDARFLRALNHPRLEVREADILDTDLPDACFDLVHARWTLMHIPARDRVLLKLIELLKPGGTLFSRRLTPIPWKRSIERAGTTCRDGCFRSSRFAARRSIGRAICPTWSRNVDSRACAPKPSIRTSSARPTSRSSGKSAGDACATAWRRRAATSRNGTANWRSSTIRPDSSSVR